jgi:hypothetical protein
LFDDLILKYQFRFMQRSEPGRQQKKPESGKFRSRDFTYINEDEDDWLLWIYQLHTSKGIAEIRFHKLMPFLVELSKYTTYSLHVAMSLKEINGRSACTILPKWQGTDGLGWLMNYGSFMLEEKYNHMRC